ncbi:MAG: lytic murein transglycosylase [Alphaproteobacteria bacterium]|nr:lytic murein transglycosylase [Alphaproteobacteria bacterium]
MKSCVFQHLTGVVLVSLFSCVAFANTPVAVPTDSAPLIAERGAFDSDRWNYIIDGVRTRATNEGVSKTVIDATLKNPHFIPSIVKSDRNQAEFKLTLDKYLQRTVSDKRITDGHKMRRTYPTMLSRVENKYGVPPHVILAFWGMESNYGTVKSRHHLVDAFFTLMYEGRREKFFTNQLIALMKIADKNNLAINEIGGSWAGAMGHFQFIPTTLASYGADGNNDGRIDIIGSIGDAMFSAGNYLNKLGWNPNERIARRVILPANFDLSLLDGKTKYHLSQWSAMGVLNPDGSAIPVADMTAGLVADTTAIEEFRAGQIANAVSDANMYGDINSMDTDVPPQPVITAYLTYPNFYRIKKWNNSNWYAIAISELSDQLR